MSTSRPASPRQQGGIALIAVLIMTVLVTLLGIAAVRTLVLQERMASNQFDRNLALQSAERTMRIAEGVAFAQSQALPQNPDFPTAGWGSLNGNYRNTSCSASGSDVSPCSSAVDGLCSQPITQCTPRWADPTFTRWATVTSTVPATASSASPSSDSLLSAGLQQQYLIEFLGKTYPCSKNPNDPYTCSLYRITVRTNQNANRAVVQIQSEYLAQNRI
jgi:type IV pilus assembly protein PilX